MGTVHLNVESWVLLKSMLALAELVVIRLRTIYRTAIPFILALFLCLASVIAFPALSTYLPDMMQR